MSADLWCVVGLGNPGPQYAGNRHNLGQMVLDELARRTGATFSTHRTRNVVGEARLGVLPGGAPGPRVVLAKPTSYMNTSGGPVSALALYFGVPPERVVVVHDELDIPFDTVKLKTGGGHGGHNGVRDVARALGTADFPRVRVGIGRPVGRQDPADWVLAPFGKEERPNLPILIADAADAVELLVGEGLLAAQQKHHAPR